MEKIDLDATDRRLLRALQRDAALPVAELAAEAGLSATPCWRRIKRLEEAGVIRARVALLEPQAIGLPVTVFVSIKTGEHSQSWLEAFRAGVAGIPEIVELYRMSGDVDYLLKIVAADIADYDRIYKKLIKVAKLTDVSSSFAMEQMKYTTELPL